MKLTKLFKANNALKQELIAKGYNERLSNLLVNRGYDKEIILALLETGYSEELPLYNDLINVEVGADIIESHIANGSTIYIFGDYDSDGVNSCYILGDAINNIILNTESNATISIKLPERCEGYGLNINWCKKIVAENQGEDILVITVDNGIAQDKEVAYLLENGIDVLITDHHTPNGHTPQNVWIIDPHYNNDSENNKGLCGAAVSFKLAMTLLDRYELKDIESLYYKYLIHVAIATITDNMPMTVENIKYVYNGLQLLKDGYGSDALDYYKEFNKNTDLTPKDTAFGIGPQINACGRMNNTKLALNYLFADNTEVEDLYNEIIITNDERKIKTKDCISIVEKQINPNAYTQVSLLENAEGIAGIIASNISSRYNKPTIIFSASQDKKYLIGSARSAMGINLLAVLKSLDTDAIVKLGGHKEACGITIKAEMYKEFKEVFESAIIESLDTIDTFEETEMKIIVDDVITISDIEDLCESINPLYFFNYSKPIFAMTNVKIVKAKPSKNNSNNIQFTLVDSEGKTFTTWVWGIGEQYQSLNNPIDVDLITEVEYKFGKPSLNILNIIPKGELF